MLPNKIFHHRSQHSSLKLIATSLFTLILSSIITTSFAQNQNGENMKDMQEATIIMLNAKSGKELGLSTFLTAGADLVAQTEPQTLLWAALKNDNGMVIFDAFKDIAGRDAHFSGQVAAALKESSEDLVAGGWNNGVLANIGNAKILSGKTSNNPYDIKLAVFIPVIAKEGQSEAVAEFLTSGADIVKESEPKTSYWYALQFSETEFAIIDFFAEQSGVDAHFEGQVAAALKENADQLLIGGWDEGVVANIQSFDVLAMVSQ